MGCICAGNKPKGKKLPIQPNQGPRLVHQLPEELSAHESSVKQEYSGKPIQMFFPLSSNELWPDCKLYEFNGELETGQLSTHVAWQNLLQAHTEAALSKMYSAISSSNCKNLAVRTVEDKKLLIELAGQLLNLHPRDWVHEYIHSLEKLQQAKELEPMQKVLQLQAHFQWLVWAVAAFLYVSISGQSDTIDLSNEFETLSGIRIGLPSSIEDWMKGFFFKNIYFTLSFSHSELGRLVRAEIRTLKAFLIEAEDLPLNTRFVAPQIVVAKIGPLILTGSAIYQDLVHVARPIETPFFRRGVALPPENVFVLMQEPALCVLLHSTYKLHPEVTRPRFILHSACVTSDVRVYKLKSNTLPKLELIKLISPEAQAGSGDITVQRRSMYGWDFDIFYDSRSRVTKKNRFAQLLNLNIEGDVAVVAQFQGPSYSRLMHLRNEEFFDAIKSSVKDCMSMLEHYDIITNHSSLHELIRRKGLSIRHSWILLSKLRDRRACELIRTDLLARAAKKYVAYSCQSSEFTLSKYKQAVASIAERLLFAEGDESYNEVYLLLFLNRLKVLKDAKRLQRQAESTHSRIVSTDSSKKINSFEYLLSPEIIMDVYSSATKAPSLFLEALELHCGFEFKADLISKAKSDNYSFVMREQTVDKAMVDRLVIKLLEPLSLREESYIFLLRTPKEHGRANRMLDDLDSSEVSFSINEEKLDLAFEIPFPSCLYKCSGSGLFKDSYELPPLQVLHAWYSTSELLLEALVTVQGSESISVEQAQWFFMRLYFEEKDMSTCKELLNKSFKMLNRCLLIPAELVAAHYMLTGLVYEINDPTHAEKYYASAVILMMKISGDPRGRGSYGLPWMIPATWKLAKIAKDDGRHKDWHVAQELFEAGYASTKHFNQKLVQYSRGRPTSAKHDALKIGFPFTKSDTLQPASWELYFAWMHLHHPTGTLSHKTWSGLTMRLNISGTKLTSDCLFSVTTSSRSSKLSFQTGSGRRSTNQSVSLFALLSPENGAIDRNSLEGVVYVWGSDKNGQLGLSITETYETLYYPRVLTPLKDMVVKEIASWYEHCIAVTIDGSCYAWGNNEFGQLGLGPDAPTILRYPLKVTNLSGVVKAACGSQHSVVVTSDYQVFTMGQGEGGLLGLGNQNSSAFPKSVRNLKDARIVSVCCGSFHSLALSKEGKIYVWGRNEGGQLGLDTSTFTQRLSELSVEDNCLPVPERVYGVLANKKIVQLACGEAHSMALTSEDQVFSWGWGGNGQLGNGVTASTVELLAAIHCPVVCYQESVVVKVF
mmetsp:Transcript_17351/g.31250  ORF Transcript_17351/g.31250 Transcript_17351/m.31250 type:complete len:1278 (-) Transcript_17351:12412-16245(-)